MPSVLLVCLGNICRSPMAEAVLAHTVKSRGLADQFTIDSAGTSGWHIGESPDSRSTACCHRHDVPVKHAARQVTADDFRQFDYIFCMDESNLHNLMRIKPKDSHAVVKLFGEYDPKGERIIEDPYYGGDDGFEHNFQQVTRCSIAFLESIGL
ncbi:phosphotyrosine protein phosphatase I superfamily [Syncephalis plumigaleata]|nr:phosphotyrosine protein phosphatase I superfamily [Syncephalis plumigaleata]